MTLRFQGAATVGCGEWDIILFCPPGFCGGCLLCALSSSLQLFGRLVGYIRQFSHADRLREPDSTTLRYVQRVVSRSAKWGGSYLGGSSWNRPQRPNPGHLRDCWGCLGRFLGRLGHRTTAIVSTRGVGKSLEFRPGAPGDFFQVDRNARE